MAPTEQFSAPDFGRAGQFPAVLLPAHISVIRKRRDFLAANRAKRQVTPGFILQARQRRSDEISTTPVRIGYTCSKKVGNAVMRNRAKRRLRETARAALPELATPGWDYVLIGRADKTINRPFSNMISDLQRALALIHPT